MAEYPEHEKLQKISDKSQTIGAFLEWLKGGHDGSPGYHICEYHEGTYGEANLIADALVGKEGEDLDPSGFIPVRENTLDLLARYFDIDQEKIETEKREMLDAMRALNS